MVELIAGPLIGDMTSAESLAADGGAGASPLGGELIIAIDPEGFLGGAAAGHLTRAEQLFDGITGQGARLPSERRYQARERSLRSEEHTSELQSLMRISYAVFCLKKKKTNTKQYSKSHNSKQH